MNISLGRRGGCQNRFEASGIGGVKHCCKLGMGNELTMSLCWYCRVGSETVAARMTLHGRLAAVAGHVFTALTFALGHVFGWEKANNLRNQDPKDDECQCQGTHRPSIR